MLHGIEIDDNLIATLGGPTDGEPSSSPHAYYDEHDDAAYPFGDDADHGDTRDSIGTTRPHLASRTARRDALLRAVKGYADHTADPEGDDAAQLVAGVLAGLYADLLAMGSAVASAEEYWAARDDRESIGRNDPLRYCSLEIAKHRRLDNHMGDRMAEALTEVFADEMDRMRADHDGEIPPTGMVPGLVLATRGRMRREMTVVGKAAAMGGVK